MVSSLDVEPGSYLNVRVSRDGKRVLLSADDVWILDLERQTLTRQTFDEESGLVVLNVGEKEQARIGMIFNIMRGDQVVAEAIVAETRADICGVFVQRLENENNPVRFNDTASLKKN